MHHGLGGICALAVALSLTLSGSALGSAGDDSAQGMDPSDDAAGAAGRRGAADGHRHQAHGVDLAGAADPHAHHREMLKRNRYSRTAQTFSLPDVALVDMNGEATSLLSEVDADRPVMLNFIFTTCTTICPLLSATFAQLQEKLGPEREQVRMISITIDPEHDTPARLQAYAERFDAGPQWRFLTGELAEVIAVQKAFGAYRGSKMNHEPLTFLRASFDSRWVRLDGIAGASDVLGELRRLVADRGPDP
jgi:protein SCO1/2